MRGPHEFRQTIILAAGNGTRLAGANGVPKPLTPVGGVPLVAHALAHARASGCVEAVVVVGKHASRVKAAVQEMAVDIRIRFVTTPDPDAPNGVSLLAAEPVAAPRFFLQMVDHVFAGITLPTLIAEPFRDGEAGRVLVDTTPGADLDVGDATKVRLRRDRVVAIGKAIEPWHAIDAGCFALTSAVFDALRKVRASEPQTVSSGMRQLAKRGGLCACDLGSVEWVDVDTAADRDAAERLIGFQRFERSKGSTGAKGSSSTSVRRQRPR